MQIIDIIVNVAFLLIQTSLSDQKEKKYHSCFISNILLWQQRVIFDEILHGSHHFYNLVQERKKYKGLMDGVGLGDFLMDLGLRFFGFALFIFKTLLLNASQVTQVHISILTSFLQHQRNWSGFIDVFLSLYCVHFPFRQWENKVTFPTESILFYWFYFLKILIELEINTV